MDKKQNTELLMKVATYMAKHGVIDVSYAELEAIIEELEKEGANK